MNLFSTIKHFDYSLFSYINGKWHNDFLDLFFLLIREAAIWIPFYLFLGIFITINFKKKGWLWALSLAMTVIISNYISSNLIKDNIFRFRPCHDPMLIGKMRILASYCPVSSSFTSSHATNHFAIAIFVYLTLKEYCGNWIAAIFFWAALICYAQVYVGVHFPIDVIAGAIVGTIIGYIAANIFNSKIRLTPLRYSNNI